MSDRRYGPDEHNADYERGREDERAAIVAYQLKDARSQRNQWANEATRHWLNTDEPSLKDRWRRAWDDGHDCGVQCGTSEERAAIVAWLRGRPSGYYGGARMASDIERGAHLAGDDVGE